MTDKWNLVKTQTTALSNRNEEANELQPYFHQNEHLDINSRLYGHQNHSGH